MDVGPIFHSNIFKALYAQVDKKKCFMSSTCDCGCLRLVLTQGIDGVDGIEGIEGIGGVDGIGVTNGLGHL